MLPLGTVMIPAGHRFSPSPVASAQMATGRVSTGTSGCFTAEVVVGFAVVVVVEGGTVVDFTVVFGVVDGVVAFVNEGVVVGFSGVEDIVRISVMPGCASVAHPESVKITTPVIPTRIARN